MRRRSGAGTLLVVMTERSTTPALPGTVPARPGLARRLGRWYERNHRDLPWRRTRDPYAIWVSEILLQQTQVATVIPYYHRFLAAFPTAAALAAAPRQAVLKQWEGLGYYARARHLHEAAARVVAEHGGQVPRDPDAVQALPGVGRSTAGAILSFAFGLRHPVLDGNVRRVLVRIFDVALLPRRPDVERWLWRAAEALLAPASDPARHNQAMVELGATVCAPRRPRCADCPVRALCPPGQEGRGATLPVAAPRRAVPHVVAAVAVIRDRRGRLLVQRRRAEGLLGGLWEFPGGKLLPGEPPEAALHREVLEELGITVTRVTPLTVVEHAYTHFRVTLHTYTARHASGRPRPRAAAACRWVAPEAVRELPLPRASLKILEALGY